MSDWLTENASNKIKFNKETFLVHKENSMIVLNDVRETVKKGPSQVARPLVEELFCSFPNVNEKPVSLWVTDGQTCS